MSNTPQIESGRPIRVGIIGLGRSGWNIHAQAISKLPQLFTVMAAADPDSGRRHEAAERFGCRVYSKAEQLIEDRLVDLVVVASPNHRHPLHVVEALGAGRHVICEKPMAATTDEVDQMIAAANRHDRMLTVFHNRRFEPHVAEIRNILASEALGRIVHVRAAVHKFTRRWDWQTLRQYGGGMLNNIGSHVLDLMLELFPVQPEHIVSHLERVLTLGDAEDHVVLMIRPQAQGKSVANKPTGPVLYLEITNAGAYEQDLWTVLGTRGSLHGGPVRLDWKIADFERLPERQLQKQTTAERRYPNDDVNWFEKTWTCPSEKSNSPYTHRCFYENVYHSLVSGVEPVVTAQSVRRLVSVLEQCQALSGSHPALPNRSVVTNSVMPGSLLPGVRS